MENSFFSQQPPLIFLLPLSKQTKEIMSVDAGYSLLTPQDIKWATEYLAKNFESFISLAELERLFYAFLEFREPLCCHQSKSQEEELHSIIQRYVLLRFADSLTDQLSMVNGTVNRSLQIIPVLQQSETIISFLNEFLLARRHLAADEHADFVTATMDPYTFGTHHVESYNAFMFKYINETLARLAPIIVQEPACCLDDFVREIETTTTPSITIARMEAIAQQMLFHAKKSSSETYDQFKTRILELLQLQKQHWNPSSSHPNPRQHKITILGMVYGPATSLESVDEGRPSHPKEAKVMNASMYAAAQYVQLRYTVTDTVTFSIVHEETVNIQICYLPVLVQSMLCSTARMPRDVQEILGEDPDDKIPYLVVKGKERIFVIMERRLVNHTLVFEKGGQLEAQARCTQESDLEGGSFIFVCYNLQKNHSGGQIMHVLLPISSEFQPITILFAAFGITNKNTMKRLILRDFHNPELRERASEVLEATWSAMPHIFAPQHAMSEHARQCGAVDAIQEAAWQHLLNITTGANNHKKQTDTEPTTGGTGGGGATYFYNRRGLPQWESSSSNNSTNPYGKILHILSTFYVHIGNLNPHHPSRPPPTKLVWRQKVEFLANQCSRLLCVLLRADPEDRHNYGGNKRLGAMGRAIMREWMELFEREVHQKIKHELHASVERHQILSLDTMQLNFTDAMRKQLTSQKRERYGHTGSKNSKEDRNAGTCSSQILDRTNIVASKSHVRATDTPSERSGRNPITRRLNPSTLGKYCTDETPDSENVGLSNHLSSCCRLPTHGNPWPILRFLECQYQSPDFISITTDLFSTYDEQQTCLVFLGGIPVGRTANPAKLYSGLVRLRRSCFGFKDLGIVPYLADGQVGAPFSHEDFPETKYAAYLYDADEDNNVNVVVLYARSLCIFTDPGRLLTPYFVVHPEDRVIKFDRTVFSLMQSNPTINMNWLCANGLVEYLGVQEEEQTVIADFPHDMLSTDILQRLNLVMRPNRTQCRLYSHCFLHPSIMKGLVSNTIPRSDCSHAPRNLYASAIGKQQDGDPGVGALENVENSLRLLYPQVPLARTLGGDILRDEEFGQTNIQTVMVLSFRGRTIEDAYPTSSRLVEQEHTATILSRGYMGSVHSNATMHQKFENPVLTRDIRMTTRFDYSSIQANGLPAVGTFIDGKAQERNVVFNRVVEYAINKPKQIPTTTTDETLLKIDAVAPKSKKRPRKTKQEKALPAIEAAAATTVRFKSIPEPAKRGDIGYVTQVERRSLRGFCREIVRIKTSHHHTAEEGDKLSTLCGHKVTISAAVAFKNWPYTYDGTNIDGAIDPTFPMNRMVCNQMEEGRYNVATLCSGNRTRMVNFGPNLDWYIRKLLRKQGQAPELCKTMYDGMTGEMLRAPVLVIVISAMFLRYLSFLKLAAQSHTPRSITTFQPVDGRVRLGGVRYGEMERNLQEGCGCCREVHDNAVVHGNKNWVAYCTHCQRKAYFHIVRNKIWCSVCDTDKFICRSEQQYGATLVEHILRAQGIGIRYVVQPRKNPIYRLAPISSVC